MHCRSVPHRLFAAVSQYCHELLSEVVVGSSMLSLDPLNRLTVPPSNTCLLLSDDNLSRSLAYPRTVILKCVSGLFGRTPRTIEPPPRCWSSSAEQSPLPLGFRSLGLLYRYRFNWCLLFDPPQLRPLSHRCLRCSFLLPDVRIVE